MFVVKIWCLYLVSRLLYSVLPETTFFDKNGLTWPQFDLYNFWPWVTSGKDFFRGCVELMPGEVLKISKRYSQPNLSHWRKTTRGGPEAPPPSGRGLTRHRLGGGGGSDPTPPLGFSGITSSFITVSTWNLAHLSGHQFGVVSCKENQNRPEIFLLQVEFCDVTSRDFGPIKGKCLKIHQK